MKTLNALLLMLMITLQSTAQEIAGKVVDEKKEPILSALVVVLQSGIHVQQNVTDFDGNYNIRKLTPGYYDLLVTYAGYDSVLITKLTVVPGKVTTQNVSMVRNSDSLKGITIKAYKKPLVNVDKANITILTAEDIKTLPSGDPTDALGLAPALYQQQRGRGVNISGARSSGTLYIIDGVQVQNIGGTAQGMNTIQQVPGTAEYKRHPENDFMNVRVNPLSTMSVDVDRASYASVRRFLNEGHLPPADAVRIEEMVNYFKYQYEPPTDNDPISINTEVTNCPWRPEHLLLRIGIQAQVADTAELPPSNIVFLIDVSGSMGSWERLPLLIEGMKLLLQKLRPVDKVSIVTYAGAAGLALPPTSGHDKERILAVLDNLHAGGSTAGGEGIRLAYKVATDNYIKGGNNRVILATDGDFNVGISSENDLEALIVKERETGVFLTCLGFGTDNFKDSKMEMMSDKGNGNYHYIDNIQEAKKSLVTEFGSTLFTVAKDVKTQIEFNPAKIQGYRLVGYENRLLNTEDFKDDKKDAGDMGAGHTVTILYELIPVGVKSPFLRDAHKLKYRKEKLQDNYSDELATIRFRYKHPDDKKSKEMVHIIDDNTTDWDNATENTRFAASVAMFGMILKESQYAGTSSYNKTLSLATASVESDNEGYRAEFTTLVKTAERLAKKHN
ncbi:MAG: von Willebrand factor type A domain-containing protein [Taibaiella sp.]|nr:von Willebrand factor type A domain-containing protein [Taibaiella sp.]